MSLVPAGVRQHVPHAAQPRAACAVWTLQEDPALSQKEAWMFPVMGSCVLFSLYIAFKFLGKDMVNLLLGAYFAVLGMLVMQQTLAPLFAMVLRSVRRWGPGPVYAGTRPQRWRVGVCQMAAVCLW